MDYTREQLDAAGDWAFPARHTPEHTPGMTLRDWFAGQAVIGIANLWKGNMGDFDNQAADRTAKAAYRMADAMLEARALLLQERN